MTQTPTRRQVLRLGPSLVTLPLVAACSRAPAPTVPKMESKPAEQKPAAEAKPVTRTPNGELKVTLPAKFTTLDRQGALSVDGMTHTAMQYAFDTLVGRDAATGNMVPRLATSWEAPDQNTWAFKIRPGVRFHDGSPLTAADVKASRERIIVQKGPVAPLFAAVEAIETLDDSTLRLKTKQPVGTIPASATLLTVGPATGIGADTFSSKPIGTGPFKFVFWRADADLRLEANEQYWSGPPAAKTLVLRHIPEVAARVTALETGEVDRTWRIPPDRLPALEGNADLTVETTPSYEYYFIWFNSSREPFTDRRVRQAMIHAPDIDTMVKDLLPGIDERPRADGADRPARTTFRRQLQSGQASTAGRGGLPRRALLKGDKRWPFASRYSTPASSACASKS